MKRLKKILFDLGIDIIGGLLIAIGIYNFAANSGFPMSGVTGISLILYHLFDFPIGITTLLLNIPIAMISFFFLGMRFFLRSIRTLIISSFLMDAIAPLFPVYSGSLILSAICTGVFAGLGFALIYANNTSTGGVDFITMSIRSKKPHLSIGRIAFFIDVAVILFGGYILRSVDGIIYGIMVSFILTTVIDKFMYGIDAGKMTLIITDYGEKIAHMIDEEFTRGATLVEGVGAYSGEVKNIVLCACNNKQMFQIKKRAYEMDPKCFVIIMESNEVVGEGFKRL